jgi:hypothetical protein
LRYVADGPPTTLRPRQWAPRGDRESAPGQEPGNPEGSIRGPAPRHDVEKDRADGHATQTPGRLTIGRDIALTIGRDIALQALDRAAER